MTCLLRFHLILLIFVATQSAGPSMTLHLFNADPSAGLNCNDGSSGGYYLREAPQGATEWERSTWIVHMARISLELAVHHVSQN